MKGASSDPAGLPSSPASERNKAPILAVLQGRMPARGRVLEIGAGTGQHAVSFAAAFPALHWLPTERMEALPDLVARCERLGPANLAPPEALDVLHGPWPQGPFAAAFSANTAHIMSWPAVCAMFAGLGATLAHGAPFFLYGPFNIDGQFTAPSNAAFDRDLRARDPAMGLRDMAALESEAGGHQMKLEERIGMPANNFTLVFRRATETSL